MALVKYEIPAGLQEQAETEHYYIDGQTRSVSSIQDDKTAERVIEAGCKLFKAVTQSKPKSTPALNAAAEPAAEVEKK
ncbi:hypothetical protein BWI97_07110 [Siphonobacter sp. BAB-5405]|uniref:hypothetical protein n=1 Tax=Siphonobacter sp. BAB-5405 TaxID=1864825 RepID=UPI000C7FB249|nr:hypothetical protein [Siphonobacter sp. BAB-5405]PMD97391.1 hypothetical protein BWI97_07110 [Siphonobacter sp. BAB-5405]